MIDFPVPETMRVHVAESRPSTAIDKFSLTDHITFVGSKQLADRVKPGTTATSHSPMPRGLAPMNNW